MDGRTIFHCGDSAYFDGFKEIGERHEIEVALLPIGGYDAPTGREVHMNPEEAVQAFLELRGKTLVPMHYGSFRLGYEPLDEPPARLMAAARENHIGDKVLLLTEGTAVGLVGVLVNRRARNNCLGAVAAGLVVVAFCLVLLWHYPLLFWND